MIFTDAHIKALQKFDFYKVDVLDGMNRGIKTVKAWGKYMDKIPFVSFVLTTCKRPATLRCTIQSILCQEFQDYEIIIIDNECADIMTDTDTQQVIREFSDSRIVYFRNLSPTVARMDRGASLARGEWICFCHDDDIFASQHLKIMTDIVREHKEINFLGCTHRVFRSKDMPLLMCNHYVANNFDSGICFRVPPSDGVFFYFINWLGGLIKRKMYAEMGGMPQIESGCGDCIMVNKFMYLYSGYYLLRIPLYFYRVSGDQISTKSDNWFNTYLAEYIFYKYGLQKMSDIPKLNRELLCNYKIHKKIYQEIDRNLWDLNWDMDLFRKKSHIAFDGTKSKEAIASNEQWEEYRQRKEEERIQKGFHVIVDEVAKIPYSM